MTVWKAVTVPPGCLTCGLTLPCVGDVAWERVNMEEVFPGSRGAPYEPSNSADRRRRRDTR